jgi:hypothetical protein
MKQHYQPLYCGFRRGSMDTDMINLHADTYTHTHTHTHTYIYIYIYMHISFVYLLLLSIGAYRLHLYNTAPQTIVTQMLQLIISHCPLYRAVRQAKGSYNPFIMRPIRCQQFPIILDFPNEIFDMNIEDWYFKSCWISEYINASNFGRHLHCLITGVMCVCAEPVLTERWDRLPLRSNWKNKPT